MTQKPPITAAEVSDQWIADCREATNQREGVPIRAHPALPAIEVYSINKKRWLPLMLPGSGTTFTDAAERDAVLAKLEGRA